MYVFIYAFNKNENTEHGFEGEQEGHVRRFAGRKRKGEILE